MRPLLLALLLFSATAHADAEAAEVQDPLEPLNRAVFAFNDGFDRWIMKPVAKGYRVVAPDFVEQGVRNFFANLGDVRNLVNNLLQFKPDAAVNDLGRLVINTTVGLGGVFDVASEAGLVKNREDFGQTLGYWGVPSGPYLMLPFLGPSSLRDAPALIPDYAVSPQTYAVESVAWRNALWALNFVSRRAELLGASETLDDIAYDRYALLRDAWMERRAWMIRDGREEQDDLLLDELDALE